MFSTMLPYITIDLEKMQKIIFKCHSANKTFKVSQDKQGTYDGYFSFWMVQNSYALKR